MDKELFRICGYDQRLSYLGCHPFSAELGFSFNKNRFASAKKGIAVKHDDTGAFIAFYFNVCAGADYGPFVRTARMGFAGFYDIAD